MRKGFNEIAVALECDPTLASDTGIDILLTDSRSLTRPESTLFFALRTQGGDGHRFIGDLYDRGVRHFVVQTLPDGWSERFPEASFICVDDTLRALHRVADMISRDGLKMIAVAGSRGKTQVKEWLYDVLSPEGGVMRSPRSYNSCIGVPLSLWELEEGTRTAIIEAGISRKGEMRSLAHLIRPEVVIFTCLDSDHDEGFSSREEKAREKAILAASPQVELIVYPLDDTLVSETLSDICADKRLVSWSLKSPSSTLYVAAVNRRGESESKVEYIYAGERRSLRLPFTDSNDLHNAFCLLAYLLVSDHDPERLEEAFSGLRPLPTRLDVREGVNGCSIIYDSFTPDLPSLLPALDFLGRRVADGQTRTLILSDLMLPPGTDESFFYERLADALRYAHIDRFIGVGPELRKHSSFFPSDSVWFESPADCLESLSTSDFSNEIILVKGIPGEGFDEIAENLEARKHETVLEVNLDAIVSNFNYFRRNVPEGTGIVAMVKASGYGAGSYEIARTMQEHGAAYLAVAVLDEGIDLRHRGITMPIMVMNPKVVNYKSMFNYRLEPEIYSMEMLGDVIREARKNGVKDYPVHIKLDTGMHRMGFVREEIPQLVEMLKSQDNVRIRSLFSHLATADCPDMDDYTEFQLKTFDEMTSMISVCFDFKIMRHILNSAGILRFPSHAFDMVRLGIGLYGVNTLPPEMEKPLAPVSTLRTVIISIREWEAGTTIGYGRKGRLDRKSRIATIPIGYADGMNRHFGCGAVSVKVNGKDAPTVGNICMDACMIDVTDIDCKVGDPVEIFGPAASVERLADLLGTIPYEILTSVSPRVKRIYYRE